MNWLLKIQKEKEQKLIKEWLDLLFELLTIQTNCDIMQLIKGVIKMIKVNDLMSAREARAEADSYELLNGLVGLVNKQKEVDRLNDIADLVLELMRQEIKRQVRSGWKSTTYTFIEDQLKEWRVGLTDFEMIVLPCVENVLHQAGYSTNIHEFSTSWQRKSGKMIDFTISWHYE